MTGYRFPPFEVLLPTGKYQVDVASYDYQKGLHTEWAMTTPIRWKVRPTVARVLWLVSGATLLAGIALRRRRNSAATSAGP